MAERDENGRFIKGHSGGPGRPTKKREDRYYEIMLTSVTFEDFKSIVKKAVEQAARGDGTARKWLADYLIGPPVQKTENVNAQMTWAEFVEMLGNDDADTE